jgi:hypothetical protein
MEHFTAWSMETRLVLSRKNRAPVGRGWIPNFMALSWSIHGAKTESR